MNKRTVVFTLFAGLVFAGTGAIYNNTFASNTSDSEFSVTLNDSAGLTLSKSSVELEIDPSIAGEFDSDSVTVTSYTNYTGGYNLSMSVNPVNLTSSTTNITTGDPYVIPTLTDDCTQAEFELDHWGVKIDSGNTFSPASANSTIIKETDSIANGDNTTVTFGAKVSLATAPGVYTSSITFVIVSNIVEPASWSNGGLGTKGSCHDGGIIGDDAGGSECPGGDGNVGSGNGLYFPANSLLRAFEVAYTQAGKPMYIEDANATNGWRPMESTDTVAGKQVRFAMQDINMTITENNNTPLSVCDYAYSSVVNGNTDEALVVDLRDGKSYWIIKAADGKCWMSQNLDLDLSANKQLTHADTDLGWSTLCQHNDSMVYSCYTADPSATWKPISSTSNVIDSHYTQPRSYSPGDKYVVTSGGSTNDISYDTLADCMNVASTHTASECYHYSVGNYYNFAAAVASNDISSHNDEGMIQMQNSICPAGWRLPMGAYGDWITQNEGTNYETTNFDAAGFEFGDLFYASGIIYTAQDGTYINNGLTNVRYIRGCRGDW